MLCALGLPIIDPVPRVRYYFTQFSYLETRAALRIHHESAFGIVPLRTTSDKIMSAFDLFF
jgi:hypothetical protein